MIQMVHMATCAKADCERPAWSHGLCWTHLKRQQRASRATGPVREYGLTPQELLRKAALRYADAPDEASYKNLEKLLRVYALESAKRRTRKNVQKPTDDSGQG